jgi:hypothetical protein
MPQHWAWLHTDLQPAQARTTTLQGCQICCHWAADGTRHLRLVAAVPGNFQGLRISKVNGQWYSMVESGKTKFSCRFHKFSLNFSWADQSRKAAQSATRCEAVVLAFDVCTPCALCGSEERAGHIGQKVRFVKGSPLDPLGLAQNRDLDRIIDGLYIYIN